MSTANAELSSGRAVETSLNYLGDVTEPLFTYAYDAPPGQPKSNVRFAPYPATIHDARALPAGASVDREGFALLKHRTAVTDFYDENQIRDIYNPECKRLMKAALGAARVQVFDHIVRNAARSKPGENTIKEYAGAVHNDYTTKSGPQRLRDLLPAEADALSRERFAILNLWRPIRGPVLHQPLAVCDARSIEPGDLVTNARIYPDRRGEIQAVRHRPTHRWYYYSAMQPDEAILLKCYDSAEDGRARFTAHTAFKDPATPPGAPLRESIEIRALVFFE
ncbi:MAG TPA: CmcJ/NvfI family oxidoreductase [Candidatus Binataceae bacterium]|nr:CmcJ/NvfI family oxidoreductase [Candidatus Binataceae bacterium]